MNTRLELGKALLIILFVVAVSYPGVVMMDACVPEDENQIILETLIQQETHKLFRSATKVEPYKEIEEIWDLEDARVEADDNLVQSMFCGEYELGYDKQNNTFYCSLGMAGEAWPELPLYAVGYENLQVAWVDDYTYDLREEAVREGYSYELFAYTQEAYSYFNLVFTGLPIVTLHVENHDEIGEEYIPARATVFGQGFEAIDSAALVHTRGGGAVKPIDKSAYRIEFHASSGEGIKKKKKVSILGMEADTDWLLLSNAQDKTAMRNYLAFDMWKRWNPDGALNMLDSQMVELFVDDEYVGLYQVIQRVSPKREIEKVGGNLKTDCAVKVVRAGNKSDKPILDLMNRTGYCVEYQYNPNQDAQQVFENLENYLLLNEIEENNLSDQQFAELVQTHMDIPDLMSYYLFLQACILTQDNVHNNAFIWMFWKDGRWIYKLSPWDMDKGLRGNFLEDGSQEIRFTKQLIVARRILDLNLQDSRKILHSIWEEKRNTVLSDEALDNWIMSAEERINASGAYRRETEKWYGEDQELNLSEILYFVNSQMQIIDELINYFWPVA